MFKINTKKFLWSLLIVSTVTIFGYLIKDLDFIQFLEHKTYDYRLKYKNENVQPHKDVVLILVDESSLKSLKRTVGRWPWPRSIWTKLIEFLVAAEVDSVLFDILFTEPQTARDKKGNLGHDDMELINYSMMGSIIHAYQVVRDTEDEYNKDLINRPLPKDFIERFALKQISTPNYIFDKSYNNFYLPIPELYQNSYGVGIVEFLPDKDGVYRQTELIRTYHHNLLPTLPISGLIKKLDVKNISINQKYISFDKLKVPISKNYKYYINQKTNFVNYSAAGILASMQMLDDGITDNLIVSPSELKDKIVFIGGSAVGIEDLKQTSLGQLPGVYLHASIVDNVLKKDFIKKIPYDNFIWIVFILCLIASLSVIGLKSLLLQNLGFPILGLGYGFFAFWVFVTHNIWIPIIIPLGVWTLFSYALSVKYVMMTEGKEKKFLKSAFSNYISPELIEKMHESGEPPKLGGDVGERTAYFTDIQGFSTFSEKLSAPKLVELLNEYLTKMTDILLEEEGTLDKYEGDAIIAFFGAPLPLPDHAERACRVAFKMQEALLELRNKWISEDDKWPEIVHNMRMRIGINSGEIVTGNMGSTKRMNYTMMGDAVNLAARLEESAKQYGIFTQLSEKTKNLADENFEFRELDTIKVVGKSIPVTTFELLGKKNKLCENLIRLKENFHLGISEYKKQNWDMAKHFFSNSLECEHIRYPGLKDKINPSCIYLDRIKNFINNPPSKDWDGVFILKNK